MESNIVEVRDYLVNGDWGYSSVLLVWEPTKCSEQYTLKSVLSVRIV